MVVGLCVHWTKWSFMNDFGGYQPCTGWTMSKYINVSFTNTNAHKSLLTNRPAHWWCLGVGECCLVAHRKRGIELCLVEGWVWYGSGRCHPSPSSEMRSASRITPRVLPPQSKIGQREDLPKGETQVFTLDDLQGNQYIWWYFYCMGAYCNDGLWYSVLSTLLQ